MAVSYRCDRCGAAIGADERFCQLFVRGTRGDVHSEPIGPRTACDDLCARCYNGYVRWLRGEALAAVAEVSGYAVETVHTAGGPGGHEQPVIVEREEAQNDG